jgi:hypothetical protein
MSRMVAVLALFVSAAIAFSAFAQTSSDPARVEPAQGTYKLVQDTSAYRGPSVDSGELKTVHAGKNVVVTGATRDFAQVSLKDGVVGYVPIDAIALLRPVDVSLMLSSDTPVYVRPHLANSTFGTLRRGMYVHVVGVALYYLEIRFDNGVVGFIPVSVVRERQAAQAP